MELNISERTKNEIAKFFLEHSVPRIIAARKKAEEEEEKLHAQKTK